MLVHRQALKRFIAAALLIFCVVAPASSLTFEQLVRRSRQMIGDTSYYNALPRMSDQAIENYINEGQNYISAQFLSMQRIQFTLTAGTTEYFMPRDFMATRRVQYKDKIIFEATLDGMDGDGRAWGVAPGIPTTYYTRTTTMTVMGFVPWPNSAATVGTITLDYYTQAATLSGPGDIPFNGLPDLYPLHETLAKYVAYRYYISVGNQTLGQIYAQEVLADITRLKLIVGTRPNYKPGASSAEKRPY